MLKIFIYSALFSVGLVTASPAADFLKLAHIELSEENTRTLLRVVDKLPDVDCLTDTDITPEQIALTTSLYSKACSLFVSWKEGRSDEVMGLQRGLFNAIQAAHYCNPSACYLMSRLYLDVAEFYRTEGSLEKAKNYTEKGLALGSELIKGHWEVAQGNLKRRGVKLPQVRSESLGTPQIISSPAGSSVMVGKLESYRFKDRDRSESLTEEEFPLIASIARKSRHAKTFLRGIVASLASCAGAHGKTE